MLVHNTRFAYCISKMCSCKLMHSYKVFKTKGQLKPFSSSPRQCMVTPQYMTTCQFLGFFLLPFVFRCM